MGYSSDGMKKLLYSSSLILSSFSIILLFFYSFYTRVQYPYDLEWMEGGMLIHAQRVMEGKQLYVEPSADFIPYIYPPLYSWLLAFCASVTELDYWVGRSLSFLGTILAGAAIFRACRLEGSSKSIALVATSFFFSTYEDGGTFFDLTRADGLLMASLAWSLVWIRQGNIRLGGLSLCVAFLFKHNAAIFGFPCLWWLWRNRGRSPAISFVLWSAVPALFMIAWLQLQSNSLFLTY